MAEFIYQEPFPLSEDTTEYRLLTKDYVKTVECDGRRILKVAPEGLELLAREAIADVSFYLRASHLQKLTRILDDPEATDNDKFVAYTMLLNQAVAAEGELPTCQDTGTAIVIGKKGEDVYTGCNDAEMLSKGIYETYRDRNLRYSQEVWVYKCDIPRPYCLSKAAANFAQLSSDFLSIELYAPDMIHSIAIVRRFPFPEPSAACQPESVSGKFCHAQVLST